MLKMLLEQKHPFYLMHGFPAQEHQQVGELGCRIVFSPRNSYLFENIWSSCLLCVKQPPSASALSSNTPPPPAAAAEDRAWLDSFLQGDYLDCRNSARVWEMVECDEINGDRSQLRVTWSSGSVTPPPALSSHSRAHACDGAVVQRKRSG